MNFSDWQSALAGAAKSLGTRQHTHTHTQAHARTYTEGIHCVRKRPDPTHQATSKVRTNHNKQEQPENIIANKKSKTIKHATITSNNEREQPRTNKNTPAQTGPSKHKQDQAGTNKTDQPTNQPASLASKQWSKQSSKQRSKRPGHSLAWQGCTDAAKQAKMPRQPA